jgi:hypothetical protein
MPSTRWAMTSSRPCCGWIRRSTGCAACHTSCESAALRTCAPGREEEGEREKGIEGERQQARIKETGGEEGQRGWASGEGTRESKEETEKGRRGGGTRKDRGRKTSRGRGPVGSNHTVPQPAGTRSLFGVQTTPVYWWRSYCEVLTSSSWATPSSRSTRGVGTGRDQVD